MIDKSMPQFVYLSYPKALKLLVERLKATPEELAVWIFLGPSTGGISAYLNANEFDQPPRFHFNLINYCYPFDYLSPLMACWFRLDELANFQPEDRFITGKQLIERWQTQPGLQVNAYIKAKIEESRLLDIHPICGYTAISASNNFQYPPMETGLFALAHVEEIEHDELDCELIKQMETQQSHGVRSCYLH